MDKVFAGHDASSSYLSHYLGTQTSGPALSAMISIVQQGMDSFRTESPCSFIAKRESLKALRRRDV